MSGTSPVASPAAQPWVCQFPMYYPHGYDHERARHLAALVAEAYLAFESDDPAKRPPPEGYDEVHRIEGGYTAQTIGDWLLLAWWYLKFRKVEKAPAHFGVVARKGNDVVVVFRGTDSLLDVLSDTHSSQVLFYDALRRKKKEAAPGATAPGAAAPADVFEAETPAEAEATQRWKDARLEMGVWDIYKTLRKDVLAAVERCWAPGRRLFVTGHSLGAGLAIAAVPDIIRNTRFRGEQRPDVYTFAGPRVVNREFALAMLQENITCYRVVHTEDIVPTLPSPVPQRWLEGLMKGRWFYSHVGTPVNFALLYPPCEGECTDKLNHKLDTYIEAMKTAPAGI
jgi:hypothetical protein